MKKSIILSIFLIAFMTLSAYSANGILRINLTNGHSKVFEISSIQKIMTNKLSAGIDKSIIDTLTSSIHVNPNPIRTNAEITFDAQSNANYTIEIINSLGQKIRTINIKEINIGSNLIIWDTNDDFGNPANDGIYYCKISSSNYSATQKMIIKR